MLAEPLSHIGPDRYLSEKDKRSEFLATHDKIETRYRHAGSRAPTTEKSAQLLASGSLRRKRTGLGLPGSWLPQMRTDIRERQSRGAQSSWCLSLHLRFFCRNSTRPNKIIYFIVSLMSPHFVNLHIMISSIILSILLHKYPVTMMTRHNLYQHLHQIISQYENADCCEFSSRRKIKQKFTSSILNRC